VRGSKIEKDPSTLFVDVDRARVSGVLAGRFRRVSNTDNSGGLIN